MRGNSGQKNYQERIVRDKNICGGDPVFAGTRVTLRTVLVSRPETPPTQFCLTFQH